jgi:hypothetical protein
VFSSYTVLDVVDDDDDVTPRVLLLHFNMAADITGNVCSFSPLYSLLLIESQLALSSSSLSTPMPELFRLPER